jgi:hypothetical protein
MPLVRTPLIVLVFTLVACSAGGQRGIADKRSDFKRFMPMTGSPSKYGLRVVHPFFKTANRAQILRAIESACQGGREGRSVFNEEKQTGYYVNCNPRNRQLLNGYVPANPERQPHSRP